MRGIKRLYAPTLDLALRLPALILAVGWQWGAVAIGLLCLVLAILIAPVRARYDTGLNSQAPISIAAAFAPVGLVARAPRLRPG